MSVTQTVTEISPTAPQDDGGSDPADPDGVILPPSSIPAQMPGAGRVLGSADNDDSLADSMGNLSITLEPADKFDDILDITVATVQDNQAQRGLLLM